MTSPGETESTLRQTVDFANSLKEEFGSLYGFHILSPFPGTEVREKAATKGDIAGAVALGVLKLAIGSSDSHSSQVRGSGTGLMP